MRPRRILRAVCLTAFAVLLALFAFVQIEQHLLRHRAELLLADFQSIRLHQSTWADAQTLMARWGAWGHYEGQCTTADCGYTITLADPFNRLSDHVKSDKGYWLLAHAVRLYELLGGKPGIFKVSFLVQDGIIWRSSTGLILDVPPHTYAKGDDYGYMLVLLARASDTLHARRHGPWILGTDDQLAGHPNYKAGRPGGCEICLRGDVTFTPSISPAELKQVTSYDLSCFTRIHFCLNLPDVLPIAREWHLYPTMEPTYNDPPPPTPGPCAIPVSARVRDADSILLVDAISSTADKPKPGEEPDHRDIQITKLRLVQILKGPSKFTPAELFTATAWPGGDTNFPWKAAEHFEPGSRYVIFPLSDSEGRQSPLYLDFCGLVENTPSVLTQVTQGLALNDNLRRPEQFGRVFW